MWFIVVFIQQCLFWLCWTYCITFLKKMRHTVSVSDKTSQYRHLPAERKKKQGKTASFRHTVNVSCRNNKIFRLFFVYVIQSYLYSQIKQKFIGRIRYPYPISSPSFSYNIYVLYVCIFILANNLFFVYCIAI